MANLLLGFQATVAQREEMSIAKNSRAFFFSSFVCETAAVAICSPDPQKLRKKAKKEEEKKGMQEYFPMIMRGDNEEEKSDSQTKYPPMRRSGINRQINFRNWIERIDFF